MMFLHTLLLVFALAPSMQEMLGGYRLQLEADALYKRHAYSEAETAFRKLASHPEQNETAAARFNLACSLYMQGKYSEAAPLFALKTKTDSKNRELRLRTLFNEGNTLAMRAIGNKEKAEKKRLFRQSLNRFKAVLLSDQNEGDAKINYEIVHRYLDELDAPKQPQSSTSRNKSNNLPASAISTNTAERLLENAQQDESALMQRLPRTGKSVVRGGRNNHDW